MPTTAVDVAFELPPHMRDRALSSSALLVARMRDAGHRSGFQLGRPITASEPAERCVPHITLFKLEVDEARVGDVVESVRGAIAARGVLTVSGSHWAHNPHGAPELYFRRSPGWADLQRAIVGAAEPLRHGRLPAADASGEPFPDLVARLRRDDPDGVRLRQLMAYGFDEVADADADLFRPHITMAWPVGNAFHVDLDGLPDPSDFDGELAGVAVFAIRDQGTCTRRFGGFTLAGA